MFDIHRHLPLEGELAIPSDWQIWFATSSPFEWITLQALPFNPLWKHGYGLAPQWLAANKLKNHVVEEYLEQLADLIDADPAGYIGEFGTDDRYSETFPLNQQIVIAKKLLHLAIEKGRPAVIHHVGSPATLFDLLDAVPPHAPIIIHGFLSSIEVARELSQRGCYISLGPRLWMQPTRIGKRMLDLEVPFCLESDFPYIPGKKCGPADYDVIMKNHYTQIAQSLKIEVEHLEERLDGLTSVLTHW